MALNKQAELFTRSPSVNKTPTAKQSFDTTGPTPQSMKMSKPSQQIDLEESISSAEGSLVSHSPLLESNEAQKMIVTSGRKWLGLLESYVQDGCLRKTCAGLLKSRWDCEGRYMTWKILDTKSSHLSFQLALSAAPKNAIESGFWPTPRAAPRLAYKENPTKSQIEGTHGWNLNAAVTDSLSEKPNRLWPTPRASEWKGTGPLGSKSHNYRLKKGYLDATVQEVGQTTGHLNPQWVAWLMGYPTEYLSSVPWETQSCRRSSQNLASKSSKRKK